MYNNIRCASGIKIGGENLNDLIAWPLQSSDCLLML